MLYNPKSQKIMISNDVVFFEADFSRNVEESTYLDPDPMPNNSLWLVQSPPGYSMSSPNNQRLTDGNFDSSLPEVETTSPKKHWLMIR